MVEYHRKNGVAETVGIRRGLFALPGHRHGALGKPAAEEKQDRKSGKIKNRRKTKNG